MLPGECMRIAASEYHHGSGWCIFKVVGDTITGAIVRTLREEQPLRLLLNLLFYHFNRSEPTYKSQRIALLHVIAAVQSIKCECSKLDIDNNLFLQP